MAKLILWLVDAIRSWVMVFLRLPGVKEEVCSGIDRYGNNLIIFNPDRPEYWNRKLPRSDIQFLWFEIPEKEEVKRLLKINLEEESGYYYVYRLLDELDVKD